ncbi:toxin-activating lysine-acyltransferase [Agrobacterium sp. NPDC090283]|uniref:toxin-activating lysine-acyltransferase n=1 Tax=Agrobacterium sp. NPDC090283 TaxID=3363920 RepID=UPI00383BDC58
MQSADHENSDLPKNIRAGKDAGQTRIHAIGHAVWLMSRSPLHKHLMITDIEWLVTPPIMLGQFHLWERAGNPYGFASWAFLGDEAEERIVTNGIRRLMPTDWKSGDQLWLIDFICPFGGQEGLIEELKTRVLSAQRFKMLQAASGGRRAVVEW